MHVVLLPFVLCLRKHLPRLGLAAAGRTHDEHAVPNFHELSQLDRLEDELVVWVQIGIQSALGDKFFKL